MQARAFQKIPMEVRRCGLAMPVARRLALTGGDATIYTSEAPAFGHLGG
jgi:hypothetical protein